MCRWAGRQASRPSDAQHVAGRAVVRHLVGDRPHGGEGEGAVVGHGEPRVIVGRRLRRRPAGHRAPLPAFCQSASTVPLAGAPFPSTTRPLTTSGSPTWPRHRSPPFGSSGAPSIWNGPSTEDGVPLPAAFTMSTSEETPSRSEKQDVFVALVVGELRGARQRVDGGAPLRLRHLVVAHEAVQMTGQRRQQGPARVPTARCGHSRRRPG